MKFSHLLIALLLIGMPFVAFAQEENVDEQEQQQEEQQQEEQQQEQVITEEDISSNTETTSDPNGYVHLVIRRSFVNKTFSEGIPALIRVQIFNLGTAVAKDVNVVDTYPIDYFVDPEEKYKFDKILPNDVATKEYTLTPRTPGKTTIPRIVYTYKADNSEEVTGYGDVEVNTVIETRKEYEIRTAPHCIDWAIVLAASFVVCVVPFFLWRKAL